MNIAQRLIHRTTLAIFCAFAALMSGCASNQSIPSDQTTIAADVSVVAFSVNASEWKEEDVWLRPKGLLLHYDNELMYIELDHDDSQPQRVLVQVPADEIAFRQFAMNSGSGWKWRQFFSGVDHSFQLTPGQVNYLGRLEIEDVRFDFVDREDRRQPVSIQYALSNALTDDVTAWEQEYQIFETLAPKQPAHQHAMESGYRAVWANQYASAGPRFVRRPSASQPRMGRPGGNDPNPGGGGGGTRPNRPNN